MLTRLEHAILNDEVTRGANQDLRLLLGRCNETHHGSIRSLGKGRLVQAGGDHSHRRVVLVLPRSLVLRRAIVLLSCMLLPGPQRRSTLAFEMIVSLRGVHDCEHGRIRVPCGLMLGSRLARA